MFSPHSLSLHVLTSQIYHVPVLWCRFNQKGETPADNIIVVWQEIFISEITHCGVWLE